MLKNTKLKKLLISFVVIIAIVVLIEVLISFSKSPSEKIIDSLKNIEIGLDEESYNQTMNAIQEVRGDK